MSVMKVQANMDADLVAKVDAFAKSMHVTRTAAMSFLLSQALDARSGMSTLSRLVDVYESTQDQIKGEASGKQ